MAMQLAVQALAAILLFGAQSKRATTPPGDARRRPAAATGRRRLAAALLASQLLLPAPAARAGAFDLRITVPEQSREEAEAVVKVHARNLVRVKGLIDARSWRELQSALRSSASNLKQDLYAIIQASPASQRPELRRLYSDLFNSVTRLDYAARDKDELQVQEYYSNIITSLEEIFSKIM
ncbi:psbQ-like protein 3, chloroplastic [Oryza brachyantha]|uniref:psbQ-like protein 3, chloroplastic n=1 Tax=Oryza brachyantha TaxID=4533 RepID=UPI001ADC55E0|nr:psbQ-like protein 3, chloroplastic [Oryza brachyantha]